MKKLRKVKIDGDSAFVPVYYRGNILQIEISSQDAEEVGKFLWSLTGDKYVHSVKGGYLHRLILKPQPREQTDHIDGNPKNNKRENLRIVTNQQNQMARHVAVGITGYKGVSKHGKGYRATIKLNGKIIRLGTYKNSIIAAKKYNAKAKELFGEYAVFNKVEV